LKRPNSELPGSAINCLHALSGFILLLGRGLYQHEYSAQTGANSTSGKLSQLSLNNLTDIELQLVVIVQSYEA
jgi:hypothetical protein